MKILDTLKEVIKKLFKGDFFKDKLSWTKIKSSKITLAVITALTSIILCVSVFYFLPYRKYQKEKKELLRELSEATRPLVVQDTTLNSTVSLFLNKIDYLQTISDKNTLLLESNNRQLKSLKDAQLIFSKQYEGITRIPYNTNPNDIRIILDELISTIRDNQKN